MANLSTQTTFTRSVWGNKVVYICDVSGTGTSTADLIVAPLGVIDSCFANFRGTGVAGTSASPSLTISGTTINVFQQAATTAQNYTITAIGR